GHNAVPEHARDRSVELADHLYHRLDSGLEILKRLLGVDLRDHAGRAYNVGEEDRYPLAFRKIGGGLLQRRGSLRWERLCVAGCWDSGGTAAAESCRDRIYEAALRADKCHGLTARAAGALAARNLASAQSALYRLHCNRDGDRRLSHRDSCHKNGVLSPPACQLP